MPEAIATATDFADLGDEAIRASIGAADAIELWPVPQTLPSGLPRVAPFNSSLLPPVLRPWVDDIAERMQAPPEFIAVPAMVAAASVIGRKVGICPQQHTDWMEVPNLWGCIVGRPGVMKSPAVQQALKPLNRLQELAREDYQHACLAYDGREVERELRDDARKKALKDRLKLNPGADTSDLSGQAEAAPVLRRYTVNDSSYQSLGELLRENTNGLLVYRDELLSLLRALDREENVEARGFYLTGWNGTDGYTFDRIGRGTNRYVPAVTLSMIGSTQPGKLQAYARSAVMGGAGDDGLLQRFGLVVWPDISPDWKEHDREPDPVARNAVFAMFERLDRMTADDVGAESSEYSNRRFLRLDADGRAEFQKWRESHEQRIRSATLHPAVESHIAKYRGLIPSLALVHHLVSGGTGPVGVLSVLSALAWGEYLESHANRVYSAAIDGSAQAARDLARHIRSGDIGTTFKPREIVQRGWSGLSDTASVNDALELLEELKWVRGIEIPTTARGGRPSIIYHFNPRGLKR